MVGACPNCLVTVDGVPNVRACTEPLREGARVERQNAFPSADHDLLGILDQLAFALPAGFYYKSFYRPRFLWALAEPVIRRLAGLGKVPTEASHPGVELVNLHPDVLVVGGGAAGLAAAAEAARAGARTLLLEASPHLGGALGPEATSELVEQAEQAGVEVRTSTAVFGVFEGPVVAAVSPGRLLRVWPRQIVCATGGIEQPAVFPDNDLPGVMPASGVERLLGLYRVLPGERAVLFAYRPEALKTALRLLAAGSQVTVVAPTGDPDLVAAVRAGGGQVLQGTVERAAGGRWVKAAQVRLADGSQRRLSCDLLVVGGVVMPAANLLGQVGAQMTYSAAHQVFLPADLPRGVHAAGAVVGASDQEQAVAQGRLAGLAAAAELGFTSRAEADRPDSPFGAPTRRTLLPAALSPAPGKQFACVCMDVTAKEIEFAVREGFDSMELLKRYTAVTMGPCQGSWCALAATRLCAELTGRTLPELGLTTSRPPSTPVPLAVLAAGHLVPRKETAIHDRHLELGAEFMWAGEWRRPHHYDEPQRECRAVHEKVAVIDVSTLGKFRVKGPDSLELLERLYPCRFGDLKVGRVRYGAMLNDQGVVLDDGTVCRVAEDEFFVTTTTGGTSAMDQWISWWLADWQLDVQVLNVTSALATVNVAGPLSRELVTRLSDLDVSPEGLPYLMSAKGEVAGVPSLILRIGFVGELGYEIHFPSAYGEHMWDAIMEVGRDLGIVPFGLEAQRILRLEKQHILVGQDTDALSEPYAAGLGWMVKLDKPDFLGRRALLAAAGEQPAERLVGFVIDGREVPPEGAAVIQDGRPVGRVCSSRWSGAVGRPVGLAWVPTAWAEEGTSFEVFADGRRTRARVTLKPFYDPEGKRLRS